MGASNIIEIIMIKDLLVFILFVSCREFRRSFNQ